MQHAAARVSVLAMAGGLALLAGCPSRPHDSADAQALTRIDAPLAWSVHRAQATPHLATSSMESQDAAPGYQFVVLDVSVRNRDRQPQVLSEGKLIAVSESNLQTFDQPVTLLSDDYLSLQVLAPAQSAHGKIAYEIPEHLPGVLYWSPGNGSKRILLNVNAPVGTLADARDDPAPETNITPQANIAADAAPVRVEPAHVATAPIASPRAAPRIASNTTHATKPRQPSPQYDRVVVPTAPPTAATTRSVIVDATPVDPARTLVPAPVPALTQAPLRTASIVSTAKPALARLSAAPPPVDPDQGRRLACQGLVARDDPAEKSGNLDFFAQSCRDYPLPAHWRPQPERRSLLARASALLGRIVVRPHVERLSDCSTTRSQADTLVCADPRLSAMDHQLTQSVERARDEVDDPAALQREQDEWRRRVRNTCDTTGCLAQAYGRRIAQLDALASRRD